MKDFDPWSVGEIKDYGKLIEDFGMESFEAFRQRFDSFRYIRRGIIFGHRDFGKIVEALDKGKPFAMMTGLMPSGRFHMGHKMVADEIIWFQQMGAETYICAADMESYLMRDVSFEDARKTALTEYLSNYFALGLKKRGMRFWFQSDYVPEYYKLRDISSKRVTLNELQSIYGDMTTGKLVSVLSQVADILHPQLELFGGPKPVVVPVGADQDPHIRLTRDIASRLNAKRDSGRDMKCIPPSATYHKFMSGLQGGKMSSSDPKSYVALSEEPKSARKKIMSAMTGGRTTVEDQKERGGEPEKCMVYELLLYHLMDDDLELSRVYHECREGKLLCGECKGICAELLERFLLKHQKKLPSARKKAEKLL
ncbi:MAG: tryptophan--tRNA ligase [Candidatus Altiarchaeales archaeon]|nr:tryptophan--tRNA ligase [Candidatus Altiarchaeales archaeon]MBD3416655.1 tryptophan--tRNA ligase [Candidatus Altiarchaeales archaeon]